MAASLASVPLTLVAAYLRTSGWELGRWRLKKYAVARVRSIGTELGSRMVRVRCGFKMELHLNDWEDQYIFATGEYEESTTVVIASLLPVGGCFVDVGANVGYFSLFASQKVGPSGRVIAFEPMPAVRTRLERNASLNHSLQVDIRNEALSDRVGVATFHLGPPTNSGMSSLRNNSAGLGLQVNTLSLDQVCDSLPRVDMIKVDVEGAEALVIAGAIRSLNRWRPDLVLEITDQFLRELGSSGEELTLALQRLGYRMYLIDCDGLLPITSWHAALPSQFNALFTVRDNLPLTLSVKQI